MRAYDVEFAPSAARSFAKLERRIQRRVAQRVEALVYTPRPRGSEKLQGTADRYRIRVGDYRIIYDVEDDALVILILRVGHRRDVYRRR